MTLPDSVTVCECWARDGLQSIPHGNGIVNSSVALEPGLRYSGPVNQTPKDFQPFSETKKETVSA